MSGRGEVVFSWFTDLNAAVLAHEWHLNFAAGNSYVFPRTREEFFQLVDSGQVVVARCGDEILGMAYYCLDGADWEVGGLMVSPKARGCGIGQTLVRVTLGHLLFQEDPLHYRRRVIAHVHAENPEPRPIFEKSLGFKKIDTVTLTKEQARGLKANTAGEVIGDVYAINSIEPITSMLVWSTAWNDKLKDGGPARINFGQLYSMEHWKAAFKDYCSRYPTALPRSGSPSKGC